MTEIDRGALLEISAIKSNYIISVLYHISVRKFLFLFLHTLPTINSYNITPKLQISVADVRGIIGENVHNSGDEYGYLYFNKSIS